MSPRVEATARGRAESVGAPGTMDGARYIESLRDGREVWLHGERVADVTQHPAFRNVVATFAGLYDLQHQAGAQAVMTYLDPDGVRGSVSYLPPTSPDELLRRRRNTEIWTERSFGMLGRLPDFCAAMLVGFHDTRAELNALHAGLGDNATRYLTYARQNDLALSHGLHDPHMDKTLRPRRIPTAACASSPSATTASSCAAPALLRSGAQQRGRGVGNLRAADDEEEFASGLPARSTCRHPSDLPRPVHPAAADRRSSVVDRYDEQDVLMIFDDVLIPWERVFLMRQPKAANALFRSRVMSWASYASILQTMARLELIIGTAHLIAETGGIAKRPHVALEMGELVSYAGMFKGMLRAAEVDCVRTPGGHYTLGDTGHIRPLIAMTSERIINIFEHVATSAPVFAPTAEDFDVPQLRPLLDVYGRGKDVSADYRHRLCRLAWELTADSFGGRQQLYERLHSGSPEVIISGAYQRYDKSKGIAMVNTLIGG